MKRLPIIPTTVVAAAVAVMIGLGIWQLQRVGEKQALLARFHQAVKLPPIAWPNSAARGEDFYFRKAKGFCLQPTSWRPTAGRNAKGESGWSFIASCRTGAEGPGMQVDMGWSKESKPPTGWSGGEVSGVIVPDEEHQIRLVSANPAPGLQPSAPPSPDTIPNNHLLYAIQWFFFAAAAALIYYLVLRRRRKQEGP